MSYYTQQTDFYGVHTPEELIETFGSPLYVYNEAVFRARCQEMKHLIDAPDFKANFSVKANSNLELLKIAREEGLYADAMSPGELHVLFAAGYSKEELFFVSNNATAEELIHVADKGVLVSIDALSQLDLFGRLRPGSDVALRVNPGIGAGHHEKVVTGGKNTKFGINVDQLDMAKTICQTHDLKVIGLNQHIGSLFLEPEPYVAAAAQLLEVAADFQDLKLIDFGGGFGIPYKKQDQQPMLDLAALKEQLSALVSDWSAKTGRPMRFKTEPGRFVCAESGVLLGSVNALKENAGTQYVGTDLGFQVLARPAMYDAWHDLEFYRNGEILPPIELKAHVVGNICESGDIVGKDRQVPALQIGDVCAVMDAGAYGYSMSSNYNNRVRPAEVLIGLDGKARCIRRRERIEDLMRCYEL